MTELALMEGPGGWIEATLPLADGSVSRSWVCFVTDDGGRWQPAGLFMLSPTPESVRAIPLHRVVVAVNADDALRSALADKLEQPVPPLGSANFLKAFSGFHRRAPRFVLERPPGHRLSDDFYRAVARAYRDAAARGLSPRAAIADDADVSTDVAGRWVYEARKRGFLPATEPGRIST
jgi:hypothetical protein